MKLLKVAIEQQRWDIAAHALVWGLVRVEGGRRARKCSVLIPMRTKESHEGRNRVS